MPCPCLSYAYAHAVERPCSPSDLMLVTSCCVHVNPHSHTQSCMHASAFADALLSPLPMPKLTLLRDMLPRDCTEEEQRPFTCIWDTVYYTYVGSHHLYICIYMRHLRHVMVMRLAWPMRLRPRHASEAATQPAACSLQWCLQA